MLEVAKAKFHSEEADRFKQLDAMCIEYDDDSFDVVACQLSVMLFPDKYRSYSEVCRVLNPNGTYIFNVCDSLYSNPFAQITQQAVEVFFPEDTP